MKPTIKPNLGRYVLVVTVRMLLKKKLSHNADHLFSFEFKQNVHGKSASLYLSSKDAFSSGLQNSQDVYNSKQV